MAARWCCSATEWQAARWLALKAGEMLNFSEEADSGREIHLCLGSLNPAVGRDTDGNRPLYPCW
ncbi:MAG: hypothetical protein ACNYPG_01590 [Candidatus Porifericomitaceae bacterium WSBS_2022_MAG_OTU9]